MVLSFASSAIAQESKESSQPKLDVHIVGAAEILKDRLRLTPARPQTVGAAWFPPKKHVTSGFEVIFKFQLTKQGGLGPGADGFAFVLQDQGLNALAGRGSAGGFAFGDGMHDRFSPGIPHSVAVFFDTFRNYDADDPSDNFIAICTNGPISKMHWPPLRLGVGKKLKIHLKDGRVHTARIRYLPPLMAVYLDDGEPEVRVPVDLSTVADSSGFSYVGFTASTGNGYENHDILTWDFRTEQVSSDATVVSSDIRFLPTYCLEGRNLCTPSEAVIEQKGPGVYHVVLPAHLEWGASLPNPDARPATVSGRLGKVCWLDGNARVFDCSGPNGVPSYPPSGLLVPESNRGALVMKTEGGRTWFSVNGPKGSDFSKNQGLFEFDVRLN